MESVMVAVVFLCVAVILVLVGALVLLTRAQARSKNYQAIYVTLSTSPKRISKIKPTIDSLLNQTVEPYRTVVHVPWVFKRTNEAFDEIPGFLANNSKVIVHRCEDLGRPPRSSR